MLALERDLRCRPHRFVAPHQLVVIPPGRIWPKSLPQLAIALPSRKPAGMGGHICADGPGAHEFVVGVKDRDIAARPSLMEKDLLLRRSVFLHAAVAVEMVGR